MKFFYYVLTTKVPVEALSRPNIFFSENAVHVHVIGEGGSHIRIFRAVAS